MSAINSISVDKLVRLIGTPRCPALIDVRPKDDFDSSPRLIPGSVRRTHSDVPEWAGEFNGQSAVPRNAPRSSRPARHASVMTDALGDPAIRGAGRSRAAATKKNPRRSGRSVWVTPGQSRPYRLPWLIPLYRPRAQHSFVAASEVPTWPSGTVPSVRSRRRVLGIEAKMHVRPHVTEFGLTEPLLRLAAFVRAARYRAS